MADTGNIEYRRVKDNGRSHATAFSERIRLYLGPDHLLMLIDQGYMEVYRRFFYRDVQSLLICRNSYWELGNAAWGAIWVILAGLILGGWLAGWHAVTLGVLAVFALVFFIIFLVNLAQGPTCTTHLKTAVLNQHLESIRRVRTATRFFSEFRDAVNAVQGFLDPSALDRSPASLPTPAAIPPPIPARPRPYGIAPPPLPPRPYRGHAHTLLFALLLIDFFMTASDFVFTSDMLDTAGLSLMIIMLGVNGVALIRQAGSNLADRIKALTWLSLFYIAATFIIGIIMALTLAVLHSRHEGDRTIEDLTPYNSIPYLFMSLFCLFCSGTLSLLGFNGLRQAAPVAAASHPETPAAPPLPPPPADEPGGLPPLPPP